MKGFLVLSFLFWLAACQVNCQIANQPNGQSVVNQGCISNVCTKQVTANNVREYPNVLKQVQSTDVLLQKNYANPNQQYRRPKRDTGYKQQYKKPNQIIEHGKVLVMPPLGEAPQNAPQPGTKYGGARPETMPYVAAMAPEGTVPIAVFPPFAKEPKNPARCVVFSELTDYEDDIGNYQYHKPTYEAHRGKRQVSNTTSEEVEHIHSLNKRESIFERLRGTFSRPSRPAAFSSSYAPPPSSYAPPASSYGAPKPTYAPPTEPPLKIVYRTFGYVCEITVSEDVCRIGTECDEYGRTLNKNEFSYASYGNAPAIDTYQDRGDMGPIYSEGDISCRITRIRC